MLGGDLTQRQPKSRWWKMEGIGEILADAEGVILSGAGLQINGTTARPY